MVVQVNDFCGTSSVTRQTASGSWGCFTRALLPGRNIPGSSRSMLVIVGDQSGQRPTSISTPHTRSTGASMSMVVRYVMALFSAHTDGGTPPGQERAKEIW